MMNKADALLAWHDIARGHLGPCGCIGDEMLQKVIDLLAYLGPEPYKIPDTYTFDGLVKDLCHGDEGLAYCLLMIADWYGFIEHGSAIRWSWLLPKGKDFLEAVVKYGTDYINDCNNYNEEVVFTDKNPYDRQDQTAPTAQ